ncbi:unnamed protein product, partial [Clonostachys byssicola]
SSQTNEPLQYRVSPSDMEVAVKTLHARDHSAMIDVKKFYKRQTDTLKKMASLNHANLISAITAYTKEDEHCFVFPWAHGGNLCKFWQEYKGPRGSDLTKWALSQIIGLTTGLEMLHKDNVRHGDVKPQNILHFCTGDRTESLGTLVLADVGLAKFHVDHTRDREQITSTRHGTVDYEPPEPLNQQISRYYDNWSLGCVILEFVIWLLYRSDGLDSFHKDLKGDNKHKRFWAPVLGTKKDLHPKVRLWISKVKEDSHSDSVVWQLADLAKTSLLVDIDRRTEENQNMIKKLKTIETHFQGRNSDEWEFPADFVTSPSFETDAMRPGFVESSKFKESRKDDSELTYFVEPDDDHQPPTAVGLPILPTIASTQQFNLLKEWIRICDDSHDCISAPENLRDAVNGMPTRVLFVGKDKNSTIRLVDSSDLPQQHYVALSHRWGDLKEHEKLCTLEEKIDQDGNIEQDGNVNQFRLEVPFTFLPKNFQDAVTVTRAIGVQCLWIDSLCIIQNSALDWEAESVRMEDVYSEAYCFLAATSASFSAVGFLNEREPRPCVTVTTPGGPLYLSKAIDNFQEDVSEGLLNTRGWPQSQFLADAHFPRSGLLYYKDERIRLVQHLYEIYSALNLTRIKDRPIAILGIETRLARVFETNAKLGVIGKFLLRMLLWHAAKK